MFMTLMRKDIPICQIHLHCLSLAGVIIKDYQILNEKEMKELFRKETGEEEQIETVIQSPETMRAALRAWFYSRVIPNSDPELDDKMLRLYGLDQMHYGRMYEYQYIGGFLSYMTSAKDDYWVNPDYTQCLSYALVDPYFKNIYFVPPAKYEEVAEKGGRFRECLRNP